LLRKWEKVLFCVNYYKNGGNSLIMTGFLGEYEATVDPKGRFLLPAGFKKQLPEDSNNLFVINRGFEKCLTLYPLSSWEPIFTGISKLNDFDPKVREFRRYFLNGATQVELDSAGRLNLPKNLLEHAGIDKDIVLVSAVNKIEIWDKSKYTQFFETFSPEGFSSLANEVMNKKAE
jgi:MraZ protein